MCAIEPYQDHVGLWAKELRDWVPDVLFDAHVHLGPPEAVGPICPARQQEPLTLFPSFTWARAREFHHHLYAGKRIAGVFAFGFPLRETRLDLANDHIVALMRDQPLAKGFVIADPTDVKRTIGWFEKAVRAGVRYSGVKPYFDLLGKSVYDTTMDEFIPRGLLEFMNRQRLVLMLHTSGVGMGHVANQGFVRSLAEHYPEITIVLAHMGRYLQWTQFLDFMDSGVMECPSVFLEMSSATEMRVYRRVLADRALWDRLLFGSDLPYGLITGVEYWSEQTGPTFLARDPYPFLDEQLQQQFSQLLQGLTYNTYHALKALKDAVDELKLTPEDAEDLKQRIFLKNAQAIVAKTD